MSRLEQQVALVTGASAGIGSALARQLAAEGARVVISARRLDRLQELAAEIEESFGADRVLCCRCDVTDENSIVELKRESHEAFGRVDILINNAGHGYVAPTTELDSNELDRIWAVNLRGPMLCAKHFLPEMARRRHGTIVNMASVSSRVGFAGGSPYVATKFGLRGFAECLGYEARPHNVRVITVYPDYVASEFFDVMNRRFPQLDQALTPATVARVVADHLCLPQEADVTEVVIRPTHMDFTQR